MLHRQQGTGTSPRSEGRGAKHTQVLYPLTEHHGEENPDEDGENNDLGGPPGPTAWTPYPRQHSYPPANVPSTPGAPLKQRAKLRPTSSYNAGVPASPSTFAPLLPGDNPTLPRSANIYSQFTRKYRPESASEDTRYDPDTNYFQRGLGQLNDPGDSDDDVPARTTSNNSATSATALNQQPHTYVNGDSPPLQDTDTLSQEERERLEWQTMLASVLDGEVFRSEKTRIVRALETFEARNNTRMDIWLGLRAWLRGRTDEAEFAHLEDRRRRVVDAVVGEIIAFKLEKTEDFSCHPQSAPARAVNALLNKLDVAQSLYPSLKVMREDKPSCASPEFVDRVDALTSWSKISLALYQQLRSLQIWTGSETLDVTQPNTTREAPIRPRGHNQSTEEPEHADTTTFVERVLKEASLQRTFEKGALVTTHTIIESARRVVAKRTPTFQELNLPSFESYLVQLISFPTKLIEASLRVRLDYAAKVKDPGIMIIDQMTEDFRLSIALACTLKREYEVLMAEDAEGYWKLPPCISDDYDNVLLKSLLLFFKLLHWKLKSGAKGIYFKETEVLDAQTDIMDEVSMTIEGGASLIAEQLCGLTNRLILRVINYFETQMEVPNSQKAYRARLSPGRPKLPLLGVNGEREVDRQMNAEDVVQWLGKVLESVRLRYRKLQRYARSLTQRFTNSAEYSLEYTNTDAFINQLLATDHFLVYTDSYEEEGLYILADSSLRDRPQMIRDMLVKAYNISRPSTGGGNPYASGAEFSDDGHDREADDSAYLLILTPNERFIWQGIVMMLPMNKINFDMEPQRVRLIADGSQWRLTRAKDRFMECFYAGTSGDEDDNEAGEGGRTDDLDIPAPLPCIVEQQSHLPVINRELRKIGRATNKLAETIVGSVHQARDALRDVQGYQELLENWYVFASEHGQHAQKHMDPVSLPQFTRMLTKLAISWVAFICDDCDPTSRKTFRWAVNALEFAMTRTHGTNILHLPDDEFALLRQKVASCMTLLISHFDILGARSSYEATKEQERVAELRRQQGALDARMSDYDLQAGSPDNEGAFANRSLRLHREEPLRKLQELDAMRLVKEAEDHMIGRVVDEEKLEDRSLLFLASSTSNISVRWQQGRFIGAGAFGSVYLAVNLDSGGLMAAKEIKFQDANSLSSLYQQVKDELSVMEILQHPNIVEYYGIEVHRDKVFIFEEYCQGGSLAALLEHGRIEDETVLQVYTMQMLDGLSYLHSKGVIHRDIKPDNVLLDHMGVIKFVDFGASKILAKNQKSMRSRAIPNPSSAGQTGIPPGVMGNSLTGTPMYMSPEVIKNQKGGRPGAMDIWSLGCVVLECATGRKPWSNLDNEWAIMFHIGVATKHPPLPEPGQLSDLGINFIKQCLTLEPMMRPSADELMNHPWMLSFRAQMLEYEQEEVSDPSTPGNSRHISPGDTELTDITRQAQILQQEETQNMRAGSPDVISSALISPP